MRISSFNNTDKLTYKTLMPRADKPVRIFAFHNIRIKSTIIACLLRFRWSRMRMKTLRMRAIVWRTNHTGEEATEQLSAMRTSWQKLILEKENGGPQTSNRSPATGTPNWRRRWVRVASPIDFTLPLTMKEKNSSANESSASDNTQNQGDWKKQTSTFWIRRQKS